MLYFAYGTNMSRDGVRHHCPGAEAFDAAVPELRFHDDDIRSLDRRSVSAFAGARAVDVGEIP
jgi:hypothetical protein